MPALAKVLPWKNEKIGSPGRIDRDASRAIGPATARPDNGSGDSPRPPFLTEFVNHTGGVPAPSTWVEHVGVDPSTSFKLTPPDPPMLRRSRKPRDPNKPPRRRKPPVSLNDEQFLALLGKAKEHRLRDWILILFTYHHGLRASEPLGVTEADFDLREGKVFVRRGKGSEGGWQTLIPWPDNPLLDERAALEYWVANREQFGVKGGAKPGTRKRRKKGETVPRGTLSGELVKMQQSTKIVAFTPNSDPLQPLAVGPGLEPAAGRPAAQPTSRFVPSFEGGNQEVSGTVRTVDRRADGMAPEAPAGPSGKAAGAFSPPADGQREALGPFPPPSTPSERLFPIGRHQFWRLVHKYALAAGIPPRKCKTHMLKHTVAKNLIRAGHPPNEVMEWMGWRSMETMMWYIRPDEEELGQRIGDRMRGMTGLRATRQGSLFP